MEKLRKLQTTHKVLARRIEQLAAMQKDYATLFGIVITGIENLDNEFTLCYQ